jgi:methylmalonyl-CoA/ethylmalonyl-CoA epimerase
MTPAPAFGLSTIGQIASTVHDIPRAIEFYRDKLGLRFVFQTPNMAFFDCAGVRLLLGLPEPGQQTFHSIIYFKVEEIHSAAAELKSRGVIIDTDPHLIARMPDHDLWLADFRDPDGNVVELMCEVKR